MADRLTQEDENEVRRQMGLPPVSTPASALPPKEGMLARWMRTLGGDSARDARAQREKEAGT